MHKQQSVNSHQSRHSPQLIQVLEDLLLGGQNRTQLLLSGSVHLKDTKEEPKSWTPSRCGNAALRVCVYLSRRGARCLLRDLVSDDGNVSPLFVQDHGELPVQLFDLQVDLILAFKHLADLTITHALVQVLNWKHRITSQILMLIFSTFYWVCSNNAKS